MTSVNILINNFSKVREFHRIITEYEGDFDLIQGRYIIDAKSLLGIFSLDISQPLKLVMHNDAGAEAALNGIHDFLATAEEE